MIQRIQTIYLLLVCALMGLFAYCPLASVAEVINRPMFCGLVVASGICSILALVSIFFYKNRKRQIMLVSINGLLIIAVFAILGVYFGLNLSELDVLGSKIYGFFIPVIALVLNILALFKIKADEKLVQSLNRIR